MDLPQAWIETTTYQNDNRTLWVVKIGTEVLKVGEVVGDLAGARAFEVATAWAAEHVEGVSFGWKHWQVALPNEP